MAPLSQEPVSLLLLPALVLGSTTASLISAYKKTFETLFPRLVQPNTQAISRLDVAIALSPSYPPSPNIPRSALFIPIQRLLAETYSLICAVAAETKVDLDFPGGLDVRIFLLETRVDELPRGLSGTQVLSGPVVDIQTFALAARPYTTIYSVEGEVGEGLLRSLITAWQSKKSRSAPPVQRLPSGPAIVQPSASQTAVHEDGPVTSHKSVAVGGTFDHLHIGHKLLLTATVLAAEPSNPSSPTEAPRLVTVGITGDALLVNKKYGSVVEPWSVRQQRTAEFIESILVFHPDVSSITKTEHIDQPGPNGKIVRVTYGADISINYTEISDPFGPTITDEGISALVISGETRAGGNAVNDKRKEKGWKELEIFEVDVLDASVAMDKDEGDGRKKQESFQGKISSTDIRRRLLETTRASAAG
ncbi:hypothetical protein A1O1_01251 [Capronia coronata CBS 617.96]|uniref:Cytidyltransferase-like domain-containing protein n=1 Tax=Capronia coronata CBS 617.96 TaxID=1182541 RepID=W9Z2D8_9EURO|nr:uncharacterized protein A1O1_01251 [Capronia coronata CBS 617.96]EXJ96125.1 hypothetical protein A1O1_01251 [Capronia coronata CBS 617.96]